MADKKVQKLQQNLLFPHGVGVELLHCIWGKLLRDSLTRDV